MEVVLAWKCDLLPRVLCVKTCCVFSCHFMVEVESDDERSAISASSSARASTHKRHLHLQRAPRLRSVSIC